MQGIFDPISTIKDCEAKNENKDKRERRRVCGWRLTNAAEGTSPTAQRAEIYVVCLNARREHARRAYAVQRIVSVPEVSHRAT